MAFLANPFGLTWGLRICQLLPILQLAYIRVQQAQDRSFFVREIKMLRGGKVLKIHRDDIFGNRYTEWCEVQHIHPLNKEYTEFQDRDSAQFLNEVGQLENDLAIEIEHYKIKSRNLNNWNLYFDKDGTVHEPEIFEAVMKGMHVDTSDFVINTAHNLRALEGHENS